MAGNLKALLIGMVVFSNSGSAFAQSADNRDRRVVLINASSSSICEFYASNVSRQSWEEDILGSDTIRPGQRVRVNIDDGTGRCLFDFRTIMCSGAEIVRRNVDVCRIDSYTIRE